MIAILFSLVAGILIAYVVIKIIIYLLGFFVPVAPLMGKETDEILQNILSQLRHLGIQRVVLTEYPLNLKLLVKYPTAARLQLFKAEFPDSWEIHAETGIWLVIPLRDEVEKPKRQRLDELLADGEVDLTSYFGTTDATDTDGINSDK